VRDNVFLAHADAVAQSDLFRSLRPSWAPTLPPVPAICRESSLQSRLSLLSLGYNPQNSIIFARGVQTEPALSVRFR
jgi:hypothetical protein